MEDVAAKILNLMKIIAEKYIEEEFGPNAVIEKAVITVPAYFNNSQKQATMDACKIAGLKCMRIINEPVAAAIACGYDQQDEDKKIMIFDLGGGTFDITIADVYDDVIEILETFGDMNLGGRDLDEALVEYCISEYL